MSSRETRLKDIKLHHEAMNEVLAGNDPQIWIDREGLEMSLGIALDAVSDYIEVCFFMDDNPLRHLPQVFPGFIWKFHEDVSLDKFVSVLGIVDYIWVTGLQVGDGFVTATEIRRTVPRVFCFLSKTYEHSGWNTMIRRTLSSCVPGIRFVKDGDDMHADTIIE